MFLQETSINAMMSWSEETVLNYYESFDVNRQTCNDVMKFPFSVNIIITLVFSIRTNTGWKVALLSIFCKL